MDIRRGFTFKGKLAVWCLIALHLVMVTPITEILPIKKEVLIPEAEAQIVNTAPVIYSLNGQLLDEIGIASLPTIEEGETFLVEPGIYDPDGDNFNVAFGTIIKILEDLSELPIEASEFSQTGAWQTTLQDQGSYKTALTATDSRGAVSTREVFFSVGDKYEPPSVDVSLSSNSVKAGEAFNITVDLNMPETAAQEGEDEVITEPELPVNYYPSGGVPGDTSENHEITYNGSTRLRTDVKRFGTSSLYVSDYGEGVNVPDSPDWQFGGGDGNFTIDFWFTPNTNHPADQVLFQQCADASNLTGCEILYSSNQVRFLIRVGVSAVVDTYSGPPLGGEFKAGTWYHVAIVRGWNGNANDWACILDGDSTFAATATGNSTTVPDRENDLWVGYGNHSGPGDTYFNGCIDEFRVSDVARWTSDFTPPADCYTDIDQYTKLLLEFDITQDMVTQEEQGGGEVIILPLPVNYYPSEGIPGDASENYEITYNGSTRLRTDVKRFGISSLYVRNPGEGVIVPGSSDWDIGKGDFTIDLWARAKELSGDSANGLCSYTSQGYDGWSIEVVFSGGYSYLAFHYGVGSYMTTIGGPDRVGLAPAVVIDKWYHIAVTKEGTTFRLFINGKLIESREVSATSPPVVDNLIIGGARSLDNQTWNNTYFWNGYIDEVRISKGIARWTSDFTPQVSRYSDIDEYTKLLLEFDIPYDVDEKYLIPTILKDGIPIEDTLGMPQFIYGNCSFDKSYTIQEPGAYEITAVVTDQAGTVSYEDSVHIEVIPEYQDATEKEARKPFSGDFNGDGMTDIGYVDTNTGTWNVCLSEGGSFGVPQTWLRDFGTPSTNVVLTGDFNGDGFTDIACVDPWYQHDGSGIFKIKFSTGSSFDDIYSDEVHSPYTKQVLSGFVDNANQSAMPFTGDFNGDGLTDVGCYINVTYNATHNEGGYKYVSFAKKDPQGGIYFTEFKELIQNFRDCIPIAADFNGDGYTDFCARQDGDGGTWTVIFNNGSDLTTDTTEISDFATGEDTIIGDFNYDGITDLGYFDKDQGKIYYRSFKVESFGQTNVLYFDGLETNTEDDEDLIAMAGDYNGDSILDAATFNKEGLGMDKWTTTLHNSKLPDLLVEIDNGIGATTKIEYEISTSFENKKLPFPIRVVKKVAKSDGMGNDYVTSYEYKDGYFETDSREFRGFGYVSVIDPEGHYKETYFNQDDTYKGRPNKEVTYDKYNRKIQEADYSWDFTQYHSGKVTYPYLDDKATTLCDYKTGDAKQLSTSYEYDEYGNTTKVREEGFTDDSGDERETNITYYYDVGKWILSKPEASETTGTPQVKTRYTYDENGSLTKEEKYLNTLNKWIETSFSYDYYGNVTDVQDALGRITSTTYDSTKTFPQSVTNAMGHTQSFTYDYSTGKILTSTDPNGQTTTSQYDNFGRLMKVTGPGGISEVTYSYDLSSSPAKTSTTTKASDTETITFNSWVDGLGRKIETISESDNGDYILSGVVEYDSRGQVVKKFLPLFAGSASYSPPSYSGKHVSYEYDPLGRVIKTIRPDNKTTLNTYSITSITTRNENNQTKSVTKDAYGRIITVEEANGNKTYYEYDLLGNLIKTTDCMGNITTITYDSFGRKISMNDPDMGAWSYDYDDVGNLISQTDAKGETITFEYDDINRLVIKETVSYTYDQGSNSVGRLSKVVDPSGTTEFFYDILGREIKTVKDIGTSYAIERTYDSLDRLISVKYPDGVVVNYTYNKQGGINRVEGDGVIYVQDTTYNTNGQITRVVYGNGTSTDYTYDEDNLRLNHLSTKKGTTAIQDLSYAFDPVGNVTAIQDSVNTNTQAFAYDILNRLTSASGIYGTINYAYDPIGNMLQKGSTLMEYGGTAGPHAVTKYGDIDISYDQNGNMITKGNALYEYDAENRLKRVSIAKGGEVSTTTIDLTAGWNFFSIPYRSVEIDGMLIPIEDIQIDTLLSQIIGKYDQVSSYDTEATGWKNFVKNPKFNQFSSFKYGEGYVIYATESCSFTIKGALPSSTQQIALYPGWNLIAGLIDRETQWLWSDTIESYNIDTPQDITEYLYDGDGGRVKRTYQDRTTIYIGSSYEITIDNTTNEVVKSKKNVFMGSSRVCEIEEDNDEIHAYFVHSDHIGSSNILTDESGSRVSLFEYKPFGSVAYAAEDNSYDTDKRFTGKTYDSTSGLHYYGARYYDSELGRFITADPTIQRPYDPQDFNRYAYCRNNPVKYVDPTGYGWWSKMWSWFKNNWQGILAIAMIVVSVVILVIAPYTAPYMLPTLMAQVSGAIVGGMSAAARGGNIGSGMLFGVLAGTVTGGAVGGMAELGYGTNVVGEMAMGGVGGAGAGASSGYAGGKGDIQDIVKGAALGAGVGAIVCGAMGVLQGHPLFPEATQAGTPLVASGAEGTAEPTSKDAGASSPGTSASIKTPSTPEAKLSNSLNTNVGQKMTVKTIQKAQSQTTTSASKFKQWGVGIRNFVGNVREKISGLVFPMSTQDVADIIRYGFESLRYYLAAYGAL